MERRGWTPWLPLRIVTALLQLALRPPRNGCTPGKVPVTPGKVPVTVAGRGRFNLQAGMSKLMSDVRGYVRLQAVKTSGYRRFRNELTGKG